MRGPDGWLWHPKPDHRICGRSPPRREHRAVRHAPGSTSENTARLRPLHSLPDIYARAHEFAIVARSYNVSQATISRLTA